MATCNPLNFLAPRDGLPSAALRASSRLLGGGVFYQGCLFLPCPTLDLPLSFDCRCS